MNRRLLKKIVIPSMLTVLGASSLVFGAPVETEQVEDKVPAVGVYRFIVPSELQETYNREAINNFTTSMETEPSTYAMAVGHVTGNPSESYVVEVYKNVEAQDNHRKSPQYQQYINEVGSKLTNRRIFDLKPLILRDKPEAYQVINDGKAYIVMTQFTVDKNYVDEVQKQFQLDIDREIRDDSGYYAGYVLHEANGRNFWTVIQFYRDEAAFKKHVSSPGYRFMMSQVQEYIQGTKTTLLNGDVLVSHGGLNFIR